MIDKDPEALQSRFDFAQSQWALYRERLQDAYYYTQPYRDKFENLTEGQSRGQYIYDTTAMQATSAYVSKLQKLLTPFGTQFMRLVPGPGIPSFLKKRLSDSLNTINDIIWNYMNQSNAILPISESYFDLACGTGVLQIKKGDRTNPLIFSAHPLSNVYLERSVVNSIQNPWRNFRIPVEDVFALWPNANIPDELHILYKNTQGNGLVDIAEGTLLNQNRSANSFTYYYTVLYKGQQIYSQDLGSSPWIIYRWSVAPMESYGVGPSQLAMPSIKSLNKLYEYLLTQGAFAMNPPMMYRSDMGINVYNTRMQPGTQIPVTGIGLDSMPIRTLDFGSKFSVGLDMIQDLRNQINKIFYNDPLGSFDESVRTATEMTLRNQENAEQMAGAFGRIAIEFLTTMMNRVLYILSDLGLIPNLTLDGQTIDLSFEIPLMQTSGLQALSKMIQTKEAITSLAGERVASLAMNNMEIPLWSAEQLGADTRLVKSPEQINKQVEQIKSRLSL